MSFNDNNLIWIDLEMTGLDPDTHKIIEIATVVTDAMLNVVAQGPVIAIFQPQKELDKMDSWCIKTHTKSGLVDRVKASNSNEQAAMQQTMGFLSKWVAAGTSPICGNSVSQDRRFLYRHMSELERFFHYRTIDVSTIKELVRRWQPDILDGFKKKGAHLALDDILESINELRYYREKIFTI